MKLHWPRSSWLPKLSGWPRRGRKERTDHGNAPLRGNLGATIVSIPVAAVAGIAGVVSYSHIVALGLRTHQGSLDSHLLAIPLDGLIVAGSVILMAGSALGWLGVALGVAGTLFANLQYGLPNGTLSAIVSTWPAVAFTVATFMLERWLKSQRGRGGRGGRAEASEGADTEALGRIFGQCQHGVAGTADEAVVLAFLHGRDCLADEPSQRNLSARFGVHRTKVAELIAPLNSPGGVTAPLVPTP